MFYGEYRHTLDDKSRLSIPSRIRMLLQGDGNDTFYLVRGLDRCIWVVTRDKWKELEKQLNSHAFTDAAARSFKRTFFSGASPANCDKQGRINVPQNLVEYAGIKRDVVIVGASDMIEIWDASAWNKYLNGSLETYEETAQTLTGQILKQEANE